MKFMMLAENKRTVCDFIEQVINTGNLQAMDRFISEAIINHNNAPGSPQGIEVYKEHLAAVFHTYKDFCLTIEDQFLDGEYVITRVTGTGIHRMNGWV
jgi:predicted SnoaL-like aldol condensation-catalyzing enzyme